jgi:hypothetical protein
LGVNVLRKESFIIDAIIVEKLKYPGDSNNPTLSKIFFYSIPKKICPKSLKNCRMAPETVLNYEKMFPNNPSLSKKFFYSIPKKFVRKNLRVAIETS